MTNEEKAAKGGSSHASRVEHQKQTNAARAREDAAFNRAAAARRRKQWNKLQRREPGLDVGLEK